MFGNIKFGIPLAALAMALMFAPAVKAPVAGSAPPPTGCFGGGKVGAVIQITTTATVPNGKTYTDRSNLRCGASGKWHPVVSRTDTKNPICIILPGSPFCRLAPGRDPLPAPVVSQ